MVYMALAWYMSCEMACMRSWRYPWPYSAHFYGGSRRHSHVSLAPMRPPHLLGQELQGDVVSRCATRLCSVLRRRLGTDGRLEVAQGHHVGVRDNSSSGHVGGEPEHLDFGGVATRMSGSAKEKPSLRENSCLKAQRNDCAIVTDCPSAQHDMALTEGTKVKKVSERGLCMAYIMM